MVELRLPLNFSVPSAFQILEEDENEMPNYQISVDNIIEISQILQ